MAASASAVGVALFFRAEYLNRQLADARKELAYIEGRREAIVNEHSVFSTKFDELVAILKKGDNDSVNLINWQIQNCRYTNGVYNQAVLLQGRFAAQHEQTVADYTRLIREIQESLPRKEEL